MDEHRHRLWDTILKAVGLAGVLIGFIAGIVQYRDAKQKEFYATLWNRRLQIYADASEAASGIATAKSIDDAFASDARRRFWQLYYGPFSLVEDELAKDAMLSFGSLLMQGEQQHGDPSALQEPAYHLAIALRNSLRTSWDRPFEFSNVGPNSSLQPSAGRPAAAELER